MDDYRRFLSSHLQFLSGLCLQATKSVNTSVAQFLSSFLITGELLSPKVFATRIQSVVDQNEMNAPVTFNRAFSLLRISNHANAVLSAYGSNFQFIDPWWLYSPSAAITRAMTYDNNCSCALSLNCTTQAKFVTIDSSTSAPIRGLKMGCTPNEAFLASTLECFYNSTCIELILANMLNNSEAIIASTHSPLVADASRFHVGVTVVDLVSKLFVENWVTSTDYLAYFNRCSPASCSYSYVQRFDALYTVTVTLGLYGGLSLILKWMCPKIIRLFKQIYQWRKQRRNCVQATSSIAMVSNTNPVQNINTVDNFVPPYMTSFLAVMRS